MKQILEALLLHNKSIKGVSGCKFVQGVSIEKKLQWQEDDDKSWCWFLCGSRFLPGKKKQIIKEMMKHKWWEVDYHIMTSYGIFLAYHS